VRILYVFPHPDDESFGPAPAIAKQRREGHEVYLLTLTRGEATKKRFDYGYSKQEMGRARYEEMQCVARVLDLTELTVLDLPDGELKNLDPREIEHTVRGHVERIRPDVIVTYNVHGISGFPDHLVTHAVVKRVFLEMRDEGHDYLRRLAFFVVVNPDNENRPIRLFGVRDGEVGAVERYSADDLDRARRALDCYVTYQDVIARHDPLSAVTDGVAFELFGERPLEPLRTVTEGF
jgi:N-acetylglucosamine malate deacetylase 2